MSGEWSPELEERSKKNLTSILQAVRRATQAKIAERLGMSEGQFSKMKSDGEFENAAKFLSACGLKAVPHDFDCHDPRYIDSLEFLAHRHLTAQVQDQAGETDSGDRLQWT